MPEGLPIAERLSSRLVRLCMASALLIGVALSLVQISIDAVRESGRIDQRMQQALSVVTSSATEAVYNIDDQLAQQVVSGLSSIDGVIGARISLPGKDLAMLHVPAPSGTLRGLTDALFEPERRYTVDLQKDASGAVLGQLEVVLDTSVAGADFVSRSLFVVGSGLIRAVLLAALLMGIFYLTLTRPLARMLERMSRIDANAPERSRFEIPPGHERDEIGGWVRQINQLLNAIRQNMAARTQAEDEASFLRQFDALTELPNRALFHDRVGQSIERARREHRTLGVVFCDISGFQQFNDERGFDFGDRLLIEIAHRLRGNQQPGEQIARISADRFAVMFEFVGDIEDALRRVEHLRSALEQPINEQGAHLALAVRFGVSLFPADARDAQLLIANAETALTLAKSQGLSALQFYEPSTGEEIRVRRRLRGELEKSLRADQFELHYQPQFDAVSGLLTGVEALLRWPLALAEHVTVESVVSIAEDAGLIDAVGEWILRRACRDVLNWKELGLQMPRIAVNVSVLQLNHPGFVGMLDEILDAHNLPAGALELEITETAIMQDVERAIARLGDIRSRGIHVTVDDFGTGHSSLQYLKTLPINCLKIDRGFVRDVCADAGDAQIVRAIVSLGRSLNLRIVAEGVETTEQLRYLQMVGCDEIQGYLLGRPMRAEDFTRFLRDHDAPRALILDRAAEPAAFD